MRTFGSTDEDIRRRLRRESVRPHMDFETKAEITDALNEAFDSV